MASTRSRRRAGAAAERAQPVRPLRPGRLPHWGKDWPLVVAYGLGVDSTAMLVGLKRLGIRPDAILFADTAGEKPETYAYRLVIDAWLRSVGFPEVEVVRYAPTRATYHTLEQQCLTTGHLPSLAYGGKSCSLKYKRTPQDRYILEHWPEPEVLRQQGRVVRAIGYDAGETARRAKMERTRKVVKAIGLDAGEEHRVSWKQAPPPPGGKWKNREQRLDALYFEYWYPLMEWGWLRPDCIRVIEAEGLPVPAKSSCFFCPAMKKHEIIQLQTDHPDLLARALALEENAMPKLKNVKGLARNWAWRDYLAGRAAQGSLYDDMDDCGGCADNGLSPGF